MTFYLAAGIFAALTVALLVEAVWRVYEPVIRFDLQRLRSSFSREQLPPPPPQVVFLGTSDIERLRNRVAALESELHDCSLKKDLLYKQREEARHMVDDTERKLKQAEEIIKTRDAELVKARQVTDAFNHLLDWL